MINGDADEDCNDEVESKGDDGSIYNARWTMSATENSRASDFCGQEILRLVDKCWRFEKFLLVVVVVLLLLLLVQQHYRARRLLGRRSIVALMIRNRAVDIVFTRMLLGARITVFEVVVRRLDLDLRFTGMARLKLTVNTGEKKKINGKS